MERRCLTVEVGFNYAIYERLKKSLATDVAKILLVDDNSDIRKILQIHIRSMGFDSITAANGKEAVERAIAEKPDLILMDFVMPAMNGGEATRILRLSPDTKDIPILAMTALTGDLRFSAASM